jgi:hypothetical protein
VASLTPAASASSSGLAGERRERPETPLKSSVQEALRLLEEAERRGVALRLLGGLAFYLRCPSAKISGLARTYGDIDVMGRQKESRQIRRLFADLGYAPRERFNALQGFRRLIFEDPENQRRVDVFLDVFEMCHKFDFSERLELDRYTLPLADLLATKLQVVEITAKDMKDAIALLLDHDVGHGGDSPVNGERIASLCAADWGVYRTFTLNLDKLISQAKECGLTGDEQRLVVGRIEQLGGIIEAAPKGRGWRMRASVGDRVRWYQLPEET